MGVFEHFPYTNFHDLNLDKILERTKEAEIATQASAEAAAASAAAAAASEGKSTLALNTANSAYSLAGAAKTIADYAKAKVDLGVQYEVIYDEVNSEITVTDLYTDTVISTEADPMTTVALANRLFGVPGSDNPPASNAEYCYPNAKLLPKVKLVWLGASTTKWMAVADAAYKGISPKLHLSFYDPSNRVTAEISFSSNVVFANAEYTKTGTPLVSNSDNGKILKVENGVWKAAAVPSAVYVVEADVLSGSFADLKADLVAGRTPTIIFPDPNDTLHYRCGVLGEIYYDNVAQDYKAIFICAEAGVGSLKTFFSESQLDNLVLD